MGNQVGTDEERRDTDVIGTLYDCYYDIIVEHGIECAFHCFRDAVNLVLMNLEMKIEHSPYGTECNPDKEERLTALLQQVKVLTVLVGRLDGVLYESFPHIKERKP